MLGFSDSEDCAFDFKGSVICELAFHVGGDAPLEPSGGKEFLAVTVFFNYIVKILVSAP